MRLLLEDITRSCHTCRHTIHRSYDIVNIDTLSKTVPYVWKISSLVVSYSKCIERTVGCPNENSISGRSLDTADDSIITTSTVDLSKDFIRNCILSVLIELNFIKNILSESGSIKNSEMDIGKILPQI